MEAHEIRVGNFIADRGGKQWQIDCWESPTKVSAEAPYLGSFPNSDIPMYGHPLTEEIDFLQPINLTEDWLLRFGFEDLDFGKEIKTIGNDSIWFFKSKFFICPESAPNEDYCVKVELKYVHQLQNLYFALTGEEITLKNK